MARGAVRTRHRSRDPRAAQTRRRRSSAAAARRLAPRPTPRSAPCARAARRAARAQPPGAWTTPSRPRSRSAATCRRNRSSPARTTSIRICPKGYQISQYERPLALGGGLRYLVGRWHARRRSPASTWRRTPASRCTRAFRTPIGGRTSTTTAAAFRSSRSSPSRTCDRRARRRSSSQAARHPGVAGRQRRQHGGGQPSLRRQCLRAAGRAGAFGTKAEVKNLNSFRYVQKAIGVPRSSGRPTCSNPAAAWCRRHGSGTRAAGRTVSMRSKEEAHDYRYFPEPDLPPVVVDAARIERSGPRCRSCLTRGVAGSSPAYGLPEYDAGVLTQSAELADYYEQVARRRPAIRRRPATGSWASCCGRSTSAGSRDRRRAVEAAGAGRAHRPRRQGRDQQLDRERRVRHDVRLRPRGRGDRGRRRAGADRRRVGARVDRAGRHRPRMPDAVAQYRGGKTATFGFLVGQVMKGSGGKANPKLANQILRRELETDLADTGAILPSLRTRTIVIPGAHGTVIETQSSFQVVQPRFVRAARPVAHRRQR